MNPVEAMHAALRILLPMSTAPFLSAAEGAPSAAARLLVTGDGLVLEKAGEEPRRFQSAADLRREFPGLGGEFLVLSPAPSGAPAAPRREALVEARPGLKGKKVRIAAGEIPALEFARFLADYRAMPILHDSADRAVVERTITIPSPIELAGDELVKRILETNRFRLTERALPGGRRVLALESLEFSPGAEEPEERPVLVVQRARPGRRGPAADSRARTAKGPEREPQAYAGVLFGAVPEMVLAQVELERGLFVVDVDPAAAGRRSDLAPLRRFDIVTHIDGATVSSTEEFIAALKALPPGASFHYRLLRKGLTRIIPATRSR